MSGSRGYPAEKATEEGEAAAAIDEEEVCHATGQLVLLGVGWGKRLIALLANHVPLDPLTRRTLVVLAIWTGRVMCE